MKLSENTKGMAINHKWLVYILIIISLTGVEATWNTPSGINNQNFWVQPFSSSVFGNGSDPVIYQNFTNSNGFNPNSPNVIIFPSGLNEVLNSPLIISWESDGYLRVYDGSNQDMIVEKYLNLYPASRFSMYYDNRDSYDGNIDLYLLTATDFLWYKFNMTNFNLEYGFTANDTLANEVLACETGYDYCIFLDDNNTIYKVDLNTKTYQENYDYYNETAGYTWNTSYPKHVGTIENSGYTARELVISDTDQDSSQEMIFLLPNSLNNFSIGSFDINSMAKEAGFGSNGYIYQTFVEYAYDPHLMAINSDGGDGEFIISFVDKYGSSEVASKANLKMYNANTGTNIYSTYDMLERYGWIYSLGRQQHIALTDCENTGFLNDILWVYQVKSTVNLGGGEFSQVRCIFKCFDNYKTSDTIETGFFENIDCFEDTGQFDPPTLNFGSGTYPLATADLDGDGYVDDFVTNIGTWVYDQPPLYPYSQTDTFNKDATGGYIIEDINDDGLNEMLGMGQGIAGLFGIYNNYTLQPPMLNTIYTCAGNPIKYGQTQRFTASFNDPQNSTQAKLGVICNINSYPPTLVWYPQSTAPTAYCNYTNVGSYTTRVCLTNNYFEGIFEDCRDQDVIVDYAGSLSQNIYGDWICQNGFSDTQEDSNITGTGGINETAFTCENNPAFCEGSYVGESFDWDKCSSWVLLKPICPFWFMLTETIVGNIQNFIFDNIYTFLIIGIIIVTVIILVKMRRRA